MGWGDPRSSPRGDRLAAAVREWNRTRTTSAEERLVAALEEYDADEPAPPSAY